MLAIGLDGAIHMNGRGVVCLKVESAIATRRVLKQASTVERWRLSECDSTASRNPKLHRSAYAAMRRLHLQPAAEGKHQGAGPVNRRSR